MLAGIALTPDTQPEAVFPLCEAGAVDTVLLLAVRAGFGGQVRGRGLSVEHWVWKAGTLRRGGGGWARRHACVVREQGIFVIPTCPAHLSCVHLHALPQKFGPAVLPKVAALRSRFPRINIIVDGGITLDVRLAIGERLD